MWIVLLLWLGLPGISGACLWDRDTLASEVKGFPETLEVIVGRFERYPDLYYQMRVERLKSAILQQAKDLALYDDLAVAYDRLGQSDRAIAWMERKRAQLDLAPDKEHEYRYFANLGTFHAHRWLKNGKNWEDMADIERACELIAKAIEINPNAHFGREKYQLMALEWIRDDPRKEEDKYVRTFLPVEDPLGVWPHVVDESSPRYRDMVKGVSGLIVLGAAWESVDVHYALAYALQLDGRSHFAKLAILSMEELMAEGKESIIPGYEPVSNTSLEQTTAPSYFKVTRAEANRWHEERTAYLMERLEQGMHPDTHIEFWRDYRSSTKPPKMPRFGNVKRDLRDFLAYAVTPEGIFGFMFLTVVIGVPLKLIVVARRNQQQAGP